ncbi:hypothetical protein GXW74_05800 [Roseomonas eburnea]|uniref:Uncharacterized protein n=1 Tax=Neoroseomonas eburnea TaxID=1346889 RepID=A0A9X9X8F6_9PROT|nr:hypothetical protein [Neoroseomonas eburnea]MBR0679992.1 hypothetical protein [Neoroseomonas eburnea]
MLSLNSLAAFTQEVTRSAGIQPVRGSERPEAAARGAASAVPQRTLGAVPPAGALPSGQTLPRGSLLDLRV